ncbi:MAG: hypothetical protein U0935_10675 [Pirellulales bacterium]
MGTTSVHTETPDGVTTVESRRLCPTHDQLGTSRSFRRLILLICGLAPSKWERFPAWIAGLLLAFPAVWLLAPAAGGSQVLACRDGAHYYYPLWQWIDGEWNAGRLPWWNPGENTGVSLAHDPTAALWYPGRWLCCLAPTFPLAYQGFLLAHLLGAAAGAYRAARQLRVSRSAAILAGLSYAYGGTVLFTYSNPIYLAGATWLAWGSASLVNCLQQLRAGASPRLASGLILPWAMLVLAGDPQSAVHLGLIALAGLACWPVSVESASGTSWGQRCRFIGRGLRSLCGAALVAALLASIQIVPTVAALRHTERAQSAEDDAVDSWYAPPRADTPDAARYEFSVGPWRWAETVVPNISGRLFPQHQRWLSALPAEGRIWSPSLYLGTIPGLLAAFAWTCRRPFPAGRWLTVVTAGGALAGMGQYGLGWLLHEISWWFTGATPATWLGSQVGGLYWLLVEVLPGYGLFRYPAKWWTVVSLGVALLAALGWDSWRWSRGWGLLLAFLLLVTTGLVAVGPGTVIEPLLASGVGRPLADPWLGPWDAVGCWNTVRLGLGQLLISLLVLLATAHVRRGPLAPTVRQSTASWTTASWTTGLLLCWTVLDLLCANGWLCHWIPLVDLLPQAAAPASRGAEPGELREERWYRGAANGWWPPSWEVHGSPQRLVETLRWERATRFPKLPLLDGAAVISREDGWQAAEWRALLAVAAERGPERPDGFREPDPAFLDAFSVRWLVLPTGTPVEARRVAEHEGCESWERTTTLPRVWLVEQIEFVDPVPTVSVPPADQLRRNVIAPGGRARDFRRSALLECSADAPGKLAWENRGRATAGRSQAPLGSCQLKSASPTQLVIDVAAERPCLLVVNDAYDPDWTVLVRTTRGTSERQVLQRVNRLMRGIWIDAHTTQVELRYRPTSLQWGAVGSGLGLLVVLGLAVLGWSGPARRLGRRITRRELRSGAVAPPVAPDSAE